MSSTENLFVRNVISTSFALACGSALGCSGGSNASTGIDPTARATDAGIPDATSLVIVSPGYDSSLDAGVTPGSSVEAGAVGDAAAARDAGAPDAASVTCGAGLKNCSSACVDQQAETNNCGACGVNCIGGTCAAGQCQPWLVTHTTQNCFITDGPTGVHAELVTDGSHVVWIDNFQGILEAPVTGDPSAAPMNLAPSSSTDSVKFRDLAIANGVVAWTMTDTVNGISVWMANVGVANSGVQVATLGTGSALDTPRGLALDATGINAYFLTDADPSSTQPSSLYKCVAGSHKCSALQATSASNSTATPNDVAIAGSRVFWTDSANGNVWRADYSQNQIARMAMNQSRPFLLGLDSSDVYWESTGGVTTIFAARRTSQSNPLSIDAVHSDLNGALIAMAVDGRNLYFSELNTTYLLEYTPVDGVTPPKALADGQQALAIATGGGAVYWLNGDNTIRGVRAP